MRQTSGFDVNNSGQPMAAAFMLQRGYRQSCPVKRGLQIGLSVFFILGGIIHFALITAVAKIVPPFLPFPEGLVAITGIMEFGFAIALWFQVRLRLTGLLLSAYLLAVLPANIYMAIRDMPVGTLQPGPFLLWGRVAMQFPMIALVLWSTYYAFQSGRRE